MTTSDVLAEISKHQIYWVLSIFVLFVFWVIICAEVTLLLKSVVVILANVIFLSALLSFSNFFFIHQVV